MILLFRFWWWSIGRIGGSMRCLGVEWSEELSSKLINIIGALNKQCLKEISENGLQLWILFYVLFMGLNQLILCRERELKFNTRVPCTYIHDRRPRLTFLSRNLDIISRSCSQGRYPGRSWGSTDVIWGSFDIPFSSIQLSVLFGIVSWSPEAIFAGKMLTQRIFNNRCYSNARAARADNVIPLLSMHSALLCACAITLSQLSNWPPAARNESQRWSCWSWFASPPAFTVWPSPTPSMPLANWHGKWMLDDHGRFPKFIFNQVCRPICFV